MKPPLKSVITAAILSLVAIATPVAFAEGAVQAKEEKKAKP